MARFATCQECGERFECQRATAKFCTPAHRKVFNNRRMLRGAEVYDLFMAMRYEREAAKAKGVWNTMCRMAQHYKLEDDRERAGRRSWDTIREVFERNVFLSATVVAANNAGNRRAK